MKSLIILYTFVFCAFALLGQPIVADSPNVVLILADDMGYSDLSRFGRTEIPTPHLDRLSDEGTIFTDAYVTAPICLPSRLGLMTGQYQQRFGIYCNIYNADIYEDETYRHFLEQTLMPEVFQRAGYRTALVGKWHLSGNSKTEELLPGPYTRGFDEFVGLRGGGADYWKGTTLYRNAEAFQASEYLTDVFGNEACAFIDRNQANPFFLYLAFNAVHAPMHALEEDQEPFSEVQDPNRKIYDGMLLAMDRNIGRVLDKLDEHGLTENTLVVFLNDNGGGGNTDRFGSHSRNFANNTPLRGHKFDLFDGGIRVPMIMRWPGRVKEGAQYRQMVSSMDLYPTLVCAAGLEMPEGQPCDGVELWPFLADKEKSKPHTWLCWQNRAWVAQIPGQPIRRKDFLHNSAVRKGDWKLVRLGEKILSDNQPPQWQLFDLREDKGENNDISASHPDVVKALSSTFESWRSSMQPPLH